MKCEGRECGLNGTKVNAVLNKVTFFQEGGRTWMRSVVTKSSETHSLATSVEFVI
jgi:hypothetical protein